MPQLPPKIPNPIITSSHPHLKMPPLSSPPPSSTTTTTPTPGWVDEFLNFTSSRRSSHRRSVSDSIAFLEVSDSATASFDDDHLFSMFSDDFSGGALVAFPSSPSSERDSHRQEYPLKCGDHHNVATCDNIADCNPPQVPKVEPPEADCAFDADNPPNSDVSAASDHHPPASGDAAVDPKRVKRILANRQSAQRSRVRKLQYISDLERSVTALQTEVSTLSPRVAFLDHQRLILNVDNSALKQRIAALAQDKIFKDAHQEALKKEIERLRQIYHQQQQQQNLKKMGNNNNNNSAITAIPPPSSGHTIDKEQLMT